MYKIAVTMSLVIGLALSVIALKQVDKTHISDHDGFYVSDHVLLGENTNNVGQFSLPFDTELFHWMLQSLDAPWQISIDDLDLIIQK